MAQISRQKDSEISNGNLINADDLDAEFNQLVNESNGQDTRLGIIESDAMTIAGVKTFSSNPKMDGIDEKTVDAGVTIDGVLLKDGQIAAHISKYTKLFQGLMVSYTSVGSITIAAGYCTDSAGAGLMTLDAPATVNITASGANGLDTGTEAFDTWYYVYLIADSSGTNPTAGLLSGTNETDTGAITMPSGYDLKRQLPIAVRNDGSGNFIPFVQAGCFVRYLVNSTYYDGTGAIDEAGTLNVLSGGDLTTFTDVDMSSYVPPISLLVYLAGVMNNTTGHFSIRRDGDSNGGIMIGTGGGHGTNYVNVPLSANQIAEYKKIWGVGAQINLDVLGFYVTEVL